MEIFYNMSRQNIFTQLINIIWKQFNKQITTKLNKSNKCEVNGLLINILRLLNNI